MYTNAEHHHFMRGLTRILTVLEIDYFDEFYSDESSFKGPEDYDSGISY